MQLDKAYETASHHHVLRVPSCILSEAGVLNSKYVIQKTVVDSDEILKGLNKASR